jgi:cytidylate kinase
VIYYKRLEQGTFERSGSGHTSSPSHIISWSDLQMVLEGIALKSIQRRKRYSLDERQKKGEKNQKKMEINA